MSTDRKPGVEKRKPDIEQRVNYLKRIRFCLSKIKGATVDNMFTRTLADVIESENRCKVPVGCDGGLLDHEVAKLVPYDLRNGFGSNIDAKCSGDMIIGRSLYLTSSAELITIEHVCTMNQSGPIKPLHFEVILVDNKYLLNVLLCESGDPEWRTSRIIVGLSVLARAQITECRRREDAWRTALSETEIGLRHIFEPPVLPSLFDKENRF
jgi:hypothetical protein